MEDNKKSIIDYFNDDQFRNNLESGVTALVAIAIVIISKGFIGGFTWDLLFTIEPYAAGIGVGIANSLLQNNMIVRGVADECENNEEIKKVLDSNENLSNQLTDYEYVEYFVDNYNKNEFAREQKLATEKEIKRLKYLVSIKKSNGKRYAKWSKKLDYVKEYGAKVKNYKPVTLQDLLSFESDGSLIGSAKLNFNPIRVQQKNMARRSIIIFILSGLVASLPLVTGNLGETAGFLLMWIPTLSIKAFRKYTSSRRITKTTYYKSLQYKKNVLTLCIESYKHYTPPTKEEFHKEDVVEILQIKKDTD